MRFEIFTVVEILIVVFCVATPCSLVSGYERFGKKRTVCTFKEEM
jgi:hypothetical protein